MSAGTAPAAIRELRVGDVVWTWGMRLLVDTAPHRTGHPLTPSGAETWATDALVLNAPEGTTTALRWTLQGNDLRAVDREVSA